MLRNSIVKTLGAVLALGMAAGALADAQLKHKPGAYKMTKFGDSGENIPLNGPVIHVFSKDGKSYGTVGNDNENLTHTSTVGGTCGGRTPKFKSAWIRVGDTAHTVDGTGEHVMKDHVESFEFPFTLPDIARKPAAACNFELDKRVANGNKSRDYWMKRGFVVKYDNAYEAIFQTNCAVGVGRGENESKTIGTPVWIACAAVKAGANPKPAAPKRAEKSRARPAPLKVTAKLEASQQGTIYAEKCPARVTYTGSINVTRPNTTVRYQITGSNWESPERKLTFDKAGTRTVTSWTQNYREQEKDLNRITASAENARKQPDASGTAKLTVTYDGGRTQSAAIPYKVYCNTKKPSRAVIKKAD